MSAAPRLFEDHFDTPERITRELCERFDGHQTPYWAVTALLRHEYAPCLAAAKRSRTIRILDPCRGLGMIPRTIIHHCPNARVLSGDIINWNGLPLFNSGDFLSPDSARWIRDWLREGHSFDVIMNPPFSLSVNFIDRALELGAHKVCVFEKISFFTSDKRKSFWDRIPLSKILLLCNRATCKRFDVIDQPMHSTIDFAWYIIEPNNPRIPDYPPLVRVYKQGRKLHV